jgi:cell division protease FtsH
MVREWGMSDRLGHIAWGAQGPVFLGEELIHTRDYSDETAHIIDEEITRMLDEQAARAATQLADHRAHLDALAAALLEHESLDATDIARILTSTPADRHTRTAAVGLDEPVLGDVVARRRSS